MSTADDSKAKTAEELKGTFCLIKRGEEIEAQLFNIRNVSGTLKKTKIAGVGSEKIEITYAKSLVSGSKMITPDTPGAVIYTDSNDEVFDIHVGAGRIIIGVEAREGGRVHSGEINNVLLQSATGKTVLLNGAVLAYLPKVSSSKKP